VVEDPDVREHEILEAQQQPMERLGLQEVPNYGRFCGHCYRRLQDEEAAECPLCGSKLDRVGTVSRVPAEAIAVFMAKRKREGLLVNTFAYVGLFIGAATSLGMAMLLPGWWRLAAVVMLVLGSYYLANLLGIAVGGVLGYRWGVSIRDRRWQEYVAQRDRSGDTASGTPSVGTPTNKDEEGLSHA
jgi:DNA-directed RNA polymerase subunit RPC12/RpoP